jgi:hypothetical protein
MGGLILMFMKKIILIILLSGSFTMFGQNCKYKIDEIDEFTKSRIIETRESLFTISGMGLGFSCGYSLKKINDSRYLKLIITSPSIFTLRKGNKIMFLTDKEETIDLYFPESVVADGAYNSSLKSTHWSAHIYIPISNNINERLLNEKLKKLRVYTADGYIDDDIKEKRAIKFVNYLRCIQ